MVLSDTWTNQIRIILVANFFRSVTRRAGDEKTIKAFQNIIKLALVCGCWINHESKTEMCVHIYHSKRKIINKIKDY